MRITSLSIPGLLLVEPSRIGDARGYFVETFRADLFQAAAGAVVMAVTTTLLVRRLRELLDVPASVTPALREENLNFKRLETTVKGRRVYTWAASDIARVKPELYAADSNGVYMSVMYALVAAVVVATPAA